MSSFNQKITSQAKNPQKYRLYTGKKSSQWKMYFSDPTGFSRQNFKLDLKNMSRELKQTMFKELKRKYENDVSLN